MKGMLTVALVALSAAGCAPSFWFTPRHDKSAQSR